MPAVLDADGFTIATPPDPKLKITVTIPSYAEPDLEPTLASLLAAARPVTGTAEVIIVVNHPEDASSSVIQQNERSYRQIVSFRQKKPDWIQIHAVRAYGIPKKRAGVGTARKIAMDLALQRLTNDDGIILCLDADTTVAPNYFRAVEACFAHKNCNGASIYFEHPRSGDLPAHCYQAIQAYELYLRYYNNALRWVGHPMAFHTVGSAMAVRAQAYRKQGGMNRRKGAEDFYFLQKIIGLGGYHDCVETTVYPAARESRRVPFGTGRFISDWASNETDADVENRTKAEAPESFQELKHVFQSIDRAYKTPNEWYDKLSQIAPTAAQYIRDSEFLDTLAQIRDNVANIQAFRQRFFHSFHLFRCLQYVHYARDHAYENVPLRQAVLTLFPEFVNAGNNVGSLLTSLREHDRRHPADLDWNLLVAESSQY